MTDHPNGKRMMEAIASFNERDLDGVLEKWTDEPIFHLPARGPHGGDYTGREGLQHVLDLVLQLSDDTYKIDLTDVLADDQYGVAVMRITASMGETPTEYDLAYSVKFDDQGRQAEAWLLASDREAYQALFS